MRFEREPLHCVDSVCTEHGRCFFCNASKSQPCRFPKYAAEISKQVANPLLRHTLSDDCTSVMVESIKEDRTP